mgnify:CR=1 FL=1
MLTLEIFTNPDLWATFALLIGLELVLGIDNILLISILSSRLPEAQRNKARTIGLALAFGFRLLFLLGASALQQLKDPVFLGLSARDLILLIGGAFLLLKAVKEIHHVVEKTTEVGAGGGGGYSKFSSIIVQIVLLDAVFSIDSVITAVGLTENLIVIYASVIVSFITVLAFAKSISDFVLGHPSLKILALSFLVCIGSTLMLEGLHHEIPKAYLYLPMGFALAVEFLELRYESRRSKKGTLPFLNTQQS